MICDEEEFNFYLGTHRPQWLHTAPIEVSLFLSHQVLRKRKSPYAKAPAGRHYAVDSGAFSEIADHGRFTTSPKEYVEALIRYDEEIGDIAWAAPQDMMCEPFMLAKTGLTLERHLHRTVENFALVEQLWDESGAPGDCPIMPVLQGWKLKHYWRCYRLYEQAGIRLDQYPIVGVGSVCRRQRSDEIGLIFRELASADLPLHGFGVKVLGLRKYGRWLVTADSMAWSTRGRRTPTECGSLTHKNEANCMTFALAWRERVLRAVGDARSDRAPMFHQAPLIDVEELAV
ncbi:hypothetical protein ABZ912_19860 [Nonomuraea angiospora]|uniref:deazapurine DNA modification protein DpdA family protein n=1 Tax=Nonomuraea angiospora TaxID=46172 RepID=UPI00340918B5